jgi:hypothetical protein
MKYAEIKVILTRSVTDRAPTTAKPCWSVNVLAIRQGDSTIHILNLDLLIKHDIPE